MRIFLRICTLGLAMNKNCYCRMAFEAVFGGKSLGRSDSSLRILNFVLPQQSCYAQSTHWIILWHASSGAGALLNSALLPTIVFHCKSLVLIAMTEVFLAII